MQRSMAAIAAATNAKRSDMSSQSATLQQFSQYCWAMLPIRKEVVGQEIVNDCVILIVQFWPGECLSQYDPGSPEEVLCLENMKRSVLRVCHFAWGDERFEGYKRLGLPVIVSALIEITRIWWRKRKTNRAKIVVWRRRWVSGE